MVLLPAKIKWTENEQLCVDNGGTLMSVRAAQTAILIYLISKVERVVIGMKKNLVTSVWEDMEGIPMEDIAWDADEPDSSQKYSFLKNGLYWDINDATNMNYSYAACSIPYE